MPPSNEVVLRRFRFAVFEVFYDKVWKQIETIRRLSVRSGRCGTISVSMRAFVTRLSMAIP
jgi:hypothetical protein